jgi:GNAT superfamily N-acetyltransferase
MVTDIALCPPARREELDNLLAAGFPSFGGVPASRRFPQLFAPAARAEVLVAQEDGRLAGCTAVRWFTWAGEDGQRAPCAMLGLVLVAPAARDVGLGSALVDAAAGLAAERGARRGVLWSAKHGFYERLGWRLADSGRCARVAGAGGAQIPPAPDAEAVARVGALRRSGVERTPDDHGALPQPGTALAYHADPARSAYALVCHGGGTGYVVDWGGDPAGFAGVWASITAAHASVLVNTAAGAPEHGWLAEVAGVRFRPQRFAMWRALGDDEPPAPAPFAVPWLDRI